MEFFFILGGCLRGFFVGDGGGWFILVRLAKMVLGEVGWGA